MIVFKCEACGVALRVADDKASKSGKCPKCGVPFVVPAASAPAVRSVTCAVCGGQFAATEVVMGVQGTIVCERCLTQGPPRKPMSIPNKIALAASLLIVVLLGVSVYMLVKERSRGTEQINSFISRYGGVALRTTFTEDVIYFATSLRGAIIETAMGLSLVLIVICLVIGRNRSRNRSDRDHVSVGPRPSSEQAGCPRG